MTGMMCGGYKTLLLETGGDTKNTMSLVSVRTDKIPEACTRKAYGLHV